MEADVDGVVVGVEAGLGASVGVGVSDASVGTGVVVASGVCELAGNAVVAARISCGVSGGSGAGADVAVSAGSRYRRHRPSWGRGLLPAAQRLPWLGLAPGGAVGFSLSSASFILILWLLAAFEGASLVSLLDVHGSLG